jgi:mRNA-degrading endonuclease RelE of RelBE toxin-antitoxin system
VATSKKTLRIELAPELKAAIRRLPKRHRQQVGEVITAVRDGFGIPHLHSGVGIRRLRDTLFECRVGLKLRLLFNAEPGVLSFTDLATHDEVRKIIKKR